MAAEDHFPYDLFDDEPWLEEEQDASEAARMSWGRGGGRRATRYVVHENVTYVASSAKAVLVRFEGGRERWVPLGQMPKNFDWEIGKTGDLEVSEWFDKKMDEDEDQPAEADVEVLDAVVLRESEKAVLIRWPGGEAWVPKGQIRDRSEVKGDGDRGKLVVSQWIAEQKGMVDARPAPAARAGSDVSQDVRKNERQKDMFGLGPDDDDEIPF